MSATPLDWPRESRAIMRALLDRKNVSYKALSRALETIGVEESPKTLSNRVGRGTFSFTFFLQCMYVLDEHAVRLWDKPLQDTPPTGLKPPPSKIEKP